MSQGSAFAGPRSRRAGPSLRDLRVGGGVLGLVLVAALGCDRSKSPPGKDAGGSPRGPGDPPAAKVPPGDDRIVRLAAAASPRDVLFGGGDEGHVAVAADSADKKSR